MPRIPAGRGPIDCARAFPPLRASRQHRARGLRRVARAPSRASHRSRPSRPRYPSRPFRPAQLPPELLVPLGPPRGPVVFPVRPSRRRRRISRHSRGARRAKARPPERPRTRPKRDQRSTGRSAAFAGARPRQSYPRRARPAAPHATGQTRRAHRAAAPHAVQLQRCTAASVLLALPRRPPPPRSFSPLPPLPPSPTPPGRAPAGGRGPSEEGHGEDGEGESSGHRGRRANVRKNDPRPAANGADARRFYAAAVWRDAWGTRAGAGGQGGPSAAQPSHAALARRPAGLARRQRPPPANLTALHGGSRLVATRRARTARVTPCPPIHPSRSGTRVAPRSPDRPGALRAPPPPAFTPAGVARRRPGRRSSRHLLIPSAQRSVTNARVGFRSTPSRTARRCDGPRTARLPPPPTALPPHRSSAPASLPPPHPPPRPFPPSRPPSSLLPSARA